MNAALQKNAAFYFLPFITTQPYIYAIKKRIAPIHLQLIYLPAW